MYFVVFVHFNCFKKLDFEIQIYRKIVISTRGTIDFEALFWAGTIQGRVQIKGGYNCINAISNVPKLRENSLSNVPKFNENQ